MDKTQHLCARECAPHSDQIQWSDYCQIEIPKECYHRKDECYVKLAMNKHSILTTIDDKLIGKLIKCEIPSKFHFKVRRPEDCIQDARA